MKSRLSIIKWSLCVSLCVSISLSSIVSNQPRIDSRLRHHSDESDSPDDEIGESELVLKLALIVFLVLLGGLLAGNPINYNSSVQG